MRFGAELYIDRSMDKFQKLGGQGAHIDLQLEKTLLGGQSFRFYSQYEQKRVVLVITFDNGNSFLQMEEEKDEG